MYQRLILYILVLVWSAKAVRLNLTESTTRVKRVVYGVPLLDLHSDYSTTKFYVWLGHMHGCNRPEGITKEEFHKNLICGGSLLTPRVVQTACHCLANYPAYVPHKVVYAQLYNVFERLFVAVAEGYTAEKFDDRAASSMYTVHQNCRVVGLAYPPTFLYDYGIILLEKPLRPYEQKTFKPEHYAPLYSTKGLIELWRLMMSKEPVCLFIGYGYYKMADPTHMDHTLSSVLRHGWTQMTNYQMCYWMTNIPIDGDINIDMFNYTRDATWFCTLELTGRREHLGTGDSGGPVSCDNYYFGIVSQGDFRKDGEYLAQTMSITYIPWENTAERRNDFIDGLEYMKTVRHHAQEVCQAIPGEAVNTQYDYIMANPTKYQDLLSTSQSQHRHLTSVVHILLPIFLTKIIAHF